MTCAVRTNKQATISQRMTALIPFCIVRHGTQRVVQRFGVVSRTLLPGVNWVTPMVDAFVSVDWSFSNAGSRVVGVDIPTNTLSFDPNELICTTRDQLAVAVDLLVEFRIDNVAKAVSQSSNLFASIESVILSAVYEIVRSLSLADVSPRVVQTAITDAVAQTSSDYGFNLVRVFVERIGIPDAISRATESVEAQRRQKIAELDKLQQESEIKLSQQRLKLMLTEAAAVEEQLVVSNNAKKRKAETQAEVEADELRLAHELRRMRALHDAQNDAFKKRLVAIAESPLSDSVKIAILRGDALAALSKDPSSKIILASQETLREQHLHLTESVAAAGAGGGAAATTANQTTRN